MSEYKTLTRIVDDPNADVRRIATLACRYLWRVGRIGHYRYVVEQRAGDDLDELVERLDSLDGLSDLAACVQDAIDVRADLRERADRLARNRSCDDIDDDDDDDDGPDERWAQLDDRVGDGVERWLATLEAYVSARWQTETDEK